MTGESVPRRIGRSRTLARHAGGLPELAVIGGGMVVLAVDHLALSLMYLGAVGVAYGAALLARTPR